MCDLIAINAGAFNLAIQALKRAGKDEIAEQLESDCECVPDLIEQQQARIVELGKERDFLVHEYERAVKCGSQGFSHAASHLYNALINPRIDLKITKKERDELAATVERLRDKFNKANTWEDVREAFAATPQQNLNAVKRDAYAEGYLHGYNHGHDVFALGSGHKPENENDLIEYANTKYPSIKDGE